MGNFLTPWMLTMFAALAPLIVIMYLLKLKRHPRTLPSTLLWRRSVQDLVANSPFQKLKNNLLLWLQLLILLLLVLALARPVMDLAGLDSKRIILLVDLSASMQTIEDDGYTRLDKAKEEALKAVEEMRAPNAILGGFTARDEMMIIGFADKTIPIQSLTTDKNALRSAIESLEATDTENNLEDVALILQEKTMVRVEDRFEPDPNANVVLISDGRLGPTADSLLDIEFLDYIKVGESIDNLGFISTEVRESFSGQFDYQVFAEITNSSEEEREVFVELELAGEVIDLKRVLIPAAATAPVVYTIAEGLTGLAKLTMVDHRDALPLDDIAYVNVFPPTEMTILLVSNQNLFIERAFGADPRTRVSRIAPNDYTAQGNYDVTIFDRVSSDIIPDELQLGNYIFVDCLPPASLGFASDGERVSRPQVIDWNRVHPITRLADFSKVQLQDAAVFTYPEGAIPLVQAVNTDLIVYHETDSIRTVVIGFDIMKSYWPVDTSYMFFVLNLIDYWSRTGRGAEKAAYATGTVVPIFPPRDATQLRITTPGDQRIDFDMTRQTTAYLTDTSRIGVYTVNFGDQGERQLPINLASNLESSIRPKESLTIGAREITASSGGISSRRELWPWLLLFGLGILMTEWFIYCRRTFL